ncbi:MAG: outer membrane beta-barrel protein [Roseibium sp.]|nr:outer membrane beta-barrel protein [Roseibium sp.]
MCVVLILLVLDARADEVSRWSLPKGSAEPVWQGAYAGIEAGLSGTGTAVRSGGVKKEVARSDAALGAFAGYNWHVSHIILGLETGAAVTGGEAKAVHSTLGQIRAASRWSATLRGRLGLPMNRFLPYVSAGVAATDYSFKANGERRSSVEIGPTIGAGLELSVSEEWRLRADYAATGIINDTKRFGGTSVKREAGNQRLMLGLSRKF